jgi:predicted DNA-binding protein (MmcQ/YjbR family)
MFTKQQIIDHCLIYPLVYEDYPFDKFDDVAVIRHKLNKKSFALIMNVKGRICINLKSEPIRADFLRRIYDGVTPGYHMNKAHWNTVDLDSDVPDDEIFAMVEQSYNLIKPKNKFFKNII